MKYLILTLSFIIFVSCKQDSHIDLAEYAGDYNGLTTSINADAAYETFDAAIAPIAQKNNLVAAPKSQSQKIIKTAQLRYETQDLEQTRAQVLQVIQKANGYLQNDNSGKDYNQLYHRITARIPTQNFEEVLDSIAKGVSFFDERTIDQKDVTEEFVDLNARLKAKHKLEERYLDLLAKAKNVKEMLEIERELAKIREEIESRQGRLQYLENQVSYSTVYIHFYKITSATGVTQSYGSKIVNAFKSGWNGISVFFLGLLHIWPFIILVALVVFLIRRWIQRRKKK